MKDKTYKSSILTSEGREFYTLRHEWAAVSSEFSDVGAADSEPRHRLNCLLKRAYEGGEWKAPTADGWELYCDRDPNRIAEAVRELNKVTKKLFASLRMMPRVSYLEVDAWFGLWF